MSQPKKEKSGTQLTTHITDNDIMLGRDTGPNEHTRTGNHTSRTSRLRTSRLQGTIDDSLGYTTRIYTARRLAGPPPPSRLCVMNFPLARVRQTPSRESRNRNPSKVLDPNSSSRIQTHPQWVTDTTMIGPNYLNPNYQQSQTWSDSASRPKSKSIAIKHETRSCPDVDVATKEESKRMYDIATWRMYNRIVDHRRNQPRYQSYTSTSIANEGKATSYKPPSTKQTSSYQAQASTSDYGEVFELDL